MKRLSTLISVSMIFFLFAVPALAQETGSPLETATDQYGPDNGLTQESAEAAINAVQDLIGQEGTDVDGAEAYAAALNAAQETGVDEKTAEVVAAQAVAEVSEEPEESKEPETSKKREITELPDTGGVPAFLLAGGILVGAGLSLRGVLR